MNLSTAFLLLCAGIWCLPGYAGAPSAGSPPFPPAPAAASMAPEYQARRAAVLEALGKASASGGLMLIRAGEPARFAGDVDYPYRPVNELVYLSGIAQPGVALLISSREIEGLGKEILFIRPEQPWEAQWVGKPLNAEQAASISGIPAASIIPIEKVAETVRKALPGGAHGFHGAGLGGPPAPAFYFDPGRPFAPDEPINLEYGFLLKLLGSRSFHLDLRAPSALLDPMRQVKSPGEMLLLRRAIDATCKAHRIAMQMARAGLLEFDVATEIEATYRREGCSGWSFPSIIGSGPNSCILHYQNYDRKLEENDLVVMDIGAEFGFYAADVTRTIPIGGRFSERQKAVYQIVYDAQEAAFKAIKPGLAHAEVHRIAKDVVAAGLIRLKLIEKAEDAGRFFPHGTSHGLGLDVHDPMPLGTLQAGMVITVEPGIYIAAEALGVRIEDDVLVTEDGCEILSRAAPRSIEEVERWMRSGSF